ncbi:hypothetical protein ACP70R_034474 [Stipagrostis hirtigluma subsp. patula]
MENNASNPQQPPPGYPTVGSEQQGATGGGKKKGSRRATTTKRGEGSFIEGWYPGRALLLLALRALLRLIQQEAARIQEMR